MGRVKLVVYILEVGFYPQVVGVFSDYYVAREFALKQSNDIGKDFTITKWEVE